jgi:hypothetical protein
VLVGSSMGATAVLVGGTAAQQSIDGIISLSAPTHISTVNAEAAVARLSAPTLFAAADDDSFDDDASTLFAAHAGRDKRLELVAGTTAHGSGLLGPSIRPIFDEFLRVHSN